MTVYTQVTDWMCRIDIDKFENYVDIYLLLELIQTD